MSCLDVMHPAYGHYAPYAPTAPAFINSLQVGRGRDASTTHFLCYLLLLFLIQDKCLNFDIIQRDDEKVFRGDCWSNFSGQFCGNLCANS